MTVNKMQADDRSGHKSVRAWVDHNLKQINKSTAILFPVEMSPKIRPHVTQYAHSNGFWLRTKATTEGLLVYQFNVEPEYTPIRQQKKQEPMAAFFEASGNVLDRRAGESVSAFVDRILNHLEPRNYMRLTGVEKSLARTYIYRTAMNDNKVFVTSQSGDNAMKVFRRS